MIKDTPPPKHVVVTPPPHQLAVRPPLAPVPSTQAAAPFTPVVTHPIDLSQPPTLAPNVVVNPAPPAPRAPPVRRISPLPTGRPVSSENHPAVTPYAVAEWWVRYLLPPNGVLLDPFCGAGTMLVVALDHGASRVYGIDREADYLDIVRRRIGI